MRRGGPQGHEHLLGTQGQCGKAIQQQTDEGQEAQDRQAPTPAAHSHAPSAETDNEPQSESASEHPIARAIVAGAQSHGVELAAQREFQAKAGGALLGDGGFQFVGSSSEDIDQKRWR
jgi:hypothetical protein